MPIVEDLTVTLTQTGQEGFYWTTTSVWTIVPEIMEFVQHLVMVATKITDYLGLPLISYLLTTTTAIVTRSTTPLTILEIAAGMTVACLLPFLLQTIILK